MQRRFHALVVTLLVLLTVSGWMGASVRPFTGTARAQVVTPDPSPPSFANQRFVIGSDNISNPSGPDTVTLATAELPDPNAFPKTTVHVHNYEGFANDQRFWLTGTFDVKLNNEVIATCEASAGRCVVDLPNQP